ncbi:MAG: hypothetical protein M0Q41_04645 [Bacteroidales bacterium]|nr:hypothetical protein [Bacteroidales bacterium]
MGMKALRAISITNILLKRWILFFKKPSLYRLIPPHCVSPTGYLKHQHLIEKMNIAL